MNRVALDTMRAGLRIAATTSIAVLLANCAFASSDDVAASGELTSSTRNVVTLKLDDYPREMEFLQSHDFDIAGVDVSTFEVDVIVADSELSRLASEGMTIVRSQDIAPDGALALDASYKTAAEVDALIHQLGNNFPAISRVKSIGKSRENRDIWAIKISKDVATHSPTKPVILFNAMHHAREIMTPEVALDTIEYLLTNYSTDATVKHWVDTNEIWVVPMLNVDGNDKVWTTDNFWRKNTRGCPANGSCPSGTGVDINRNYPYKWGACNGSSDSPTSETYRGASGGSEAETRALMNHVANTRPVLDISYHSYSELILYPLGCQGVQAPTRDILRSIADGMSAKLPRDGGSGLYTAGTPWELIYAADGTDIDWMYNQYSVASFAIEINSTSEGFQPSYAMWRDRTVKKLRGAWQFLLTRLDGSGVRGVVPAGVTGATVEVTRSGTATQKRNVNPDGSFHVLLVPGTYHVKVSAPGKTPFERDITVGSSRVNLQVTF